jgi:hypothetical protein
MLKAQLNASNSGRKVSSGNRESCTRRGGGTDRSHDGGRASPFV